MLDHVSETTSKKNANLTMRIILQKVTVKLVSLLLHRFLLHQVDSVVLELDEDEEKQDSDLVEAQELGQVPLFAVLPSTVEGLTDFSLKELKLHFLCYAGSECKYFSHIKSE